MRHKNITEMDGIAGVTTGLLLLAGAALIATGDITVGIVNTEPFVYALLAGGLAIAARGIWNTWNGKHSKDYRTE